MKNLYSTKLKKALIDTVLYLIIIGIIMYYFGGESMKLDPGVLLHLDKLAECLGFFFIPTIFFFAVKSILWMFINYINTLLELIIEVGVIGLFFDVFVLLIPLVIGVNVLCYILTFITEHTSDTFQNIFACLMGIMFLVYFFIRPIYYGVRYMKTPKEECIMAA